MTKSLYSDDKRDGISWFDDHLSDVACRAAGELDFIRIGKAAGHCHVTVLAGWLLAYADSTDRYELHQSVFLARLMKHIGRERPGTRDAVRPFAREIGKAISQSTIFDPTLEGDGWKRLDLIHLCVEISKLAAADMYYGGRRPPGHWRGVNWHDRS